MVHAIFVKANMSKTISLACCGTSPLPHLKGADDLAKVFRALADETRLRILALLRDGEVCVCHIHGGLRLPQPTVSRHLAYLRKTGLVECRRQGVWMYYRLGVPKSPVMHQVLHSALHALSHAEITSTDAVRLRNELAAG
jgi:ArsR family transcriptional regulator, arsenate/arsenite/antimonite-responsive transcriptional repressor